VSPVWVGAPPQGSRFRYAPSAALRRAFAS
jgi:hypothetical protein